MSTTAHVKIVDGEKAIFLWTHADGTFGQILDYIEDVFVIWDEENYDMIDIYRFATYLCIVSRFESDGEVELGFEIAPKIHDVGGEWEDTDIQITLHEDGIEIRTFEPWMLNDSDDQEEGFCTIFINYDPDSYLVQKIIENVG